MKKPTAYFDTSIISAYWAEGPDVTLLSRRSLTRDWWNAERQHFSLWSSRVSETELSVGTFPRQHECLSMVRRLRFLPVTTAVRDLAQEIMRRNIVPQSNSADAAHLAISAMHGVDYLLT